MSIARGRFMPELWMRLSQGSRHFFSSSDRGGCPSIPNILGRYAAMAIPFFFFPLHPLSESMEKKRDPTRKKPLAASTHDSVYLLRMRRDRFKTRDKGAEECQIVAVFFFPPFFFLLFSLHHSECLFLCFSAGRGEEKGADRRRRRLAAMAASGGCLSLASFFFFSLLQALACAGQGKGGEKFVVRSRKKGILVDRGCSSKVDARLNSKAQGKRKREKGERKKKRKGCRANTSR